MSAKDYSPNVVASSFIKQYYEMMAKHPENLHKFYNEDSHFLHSDLNHTGGVNGSGPESIRAAISSLNLKNTKVDLSNGYIDAQKSANNGVVVVVVGQLSFPGGTGKPFVQSFLLSNQASSAYYVSNSVFRLLVPSEEQGDINSVLVNLAPPSAAYTQPTAAWTAEKPVAAAAPAPAAAAAVPEESSAATAVDASGDRLSGYVAVESLLQEAANEPDVHVAAAAAPEPAVEAAAAPVAEVAAPAAPTPAPVAAVATPPAAPAAPVDPLKKLNYSDIVKKINSGAAAPAAPAAAAPTHRVIPTPVVATAPSPAAAAHSIYIKQVPEAATSAELHTLFSAFGNVLSVDQQAGKSFAFVKYENAAAVQAAVAATSGDKTLALHGQNLRVEERNSTRTGSSSGAGGAHQGNNNGGNNGGRPREQRTGERSGRERDGRENRGDRSGPRTGGGDNKGARSGDNKGGNRGPTSNTGGNNTKAK